MKHLQVKANSSPLLMIKNGKKVNILSDGELERDIEFITFDTIKTGDSKDVFKVVNFITSRIPSGNYQGFTNPVITEIEVMKSEISYSDLLLLANGN